MSDHKNLPPILADKHYRSTSAFTPESLLREARRQKDAAAVAVPKICLLDPDGDIVRQLQAEGRARKHKGWVCYHTEMWVFDLDGREVGVVGCAVGAAFAVLVAEEMFASGLRSLDQRHVIGTNHAYTDAALLHPDRPSLTRRRNELSLRAAGRLEHGPLASCRTSRGRVQAP